MKRKEPIYKYQQIMLIDDSELDNFINQKVIESSYFSNKIYVNTSSISALEFLKNIAITGEISSEIYPQVIFIDLNMPMVDGFQFIEFFKAIPNIHSENFKLVILTSSVHPNDRKKAAELSENIVFLNKPLTKEMLTEI